MNMAKMATATCLSFVPLAAAAAPVAWLDEPAAMPAAEAARAAPAASCSDRDLTLTLGGAGAYRGQATQELLLRNDAARHCRLTALPAIELNLPRGWQAAASALADDAAIVLAPGASLALLLGTPGACDATIGPARQTVRQLRVLPPGGGVIVTHGARIDTTCGPARLLRADVHDAPAASPRAGSIGSLTAQVDAPAAVAAGTRFSYFVSLKNPTDQPVNLSPCPAYTQVLNTARATQSGAWRLNCAGAGGVLPAHGELTFEMQARVPEGAPPGGVKLSWQMAGGPSVGTVIPLR